MELLDYICLVSCIFPLTTFRHSLILFKTVSAGLSVQEQFTTGGVLWFPDLTALDSTWILPVSVGVINLLIVEVSGFKRDLFDIFVIGAFVDTVLMSNTPVSELAPSL